MNYKQLKILAVACMFFDHATLLFPIERLLGPAADFLWSAGMEGPADFLLNGLPYLLKFIGRLAAPIFAFCIVNGFFHTYNVGKYIGRLAVTALLAQLPYVLFDMAECRLSGIKFNWTDSGLNILFTFALGLSAVAAFDALKKRGLLFAGILTAVAAGLLARVLNMEGHEGYILILFAFYFLNGQGKALSALSFVPVMLLSRVNLVLELLKDFRFLRTVLLNVFGNYLGVLVPILVYNGEKGKAGRGFQWFMYAFYPLHFLLLAAAGFLIPPAL